MNRQEQDKQLVNMNFNHIEEMDPCLGISFWYKLANRGRICDFV